MAENQNQLAYDIAEAYENTETILKAIDAVRIKHPDIPTSLITNAWNAINAYYDLYFEKDKA